MQWTSGDKSTKQNKVYNGPREIKVLYKTKYTMDSDIQFLMKSNEDYTKKY